jgi:putative lipoic acid-binding regulatory protein
VPDLPSVDLLEQTHQFPCAYMFKAIGEDDHTFSGRVVAAVRHEITDDHEPAIRIRKTASGRHVCVTIEPFVADAQQVLSIYERIYALDGLVMVW